MENMVAEKMSLLARASYLGEIEGLFTCQIHGLHMPKVMESLTILGCVEHIIIYSNLFAKVI